jgi:hypothetical protein
MERLGGARSEPEIGPISRQKISTGSRFGLAKQCVQALTRRLGLKGGRQGAPAITAVPGAQSSPGDPSATQEKRPICREGSTRIARSPLWGRTGEPMPRTVPDRV